MIPDVAVVLASAGRPEILAQAIRYIEELSGPEILKVVSVPDMDSLSSAELGSDWLIAQGVRGLSAQRNNALKALPTSIEFVFFFDDDACIRADYVERAMEVFERSSDIVALTGTVLADGKLTGEIGREAAEAIVMKSYRRPLSGRWIPTRELYGANFAIRWNSRDPIWFDERLPLYSWLEDHDIARRLLKRGTLANCEDCIIVHRAAASGGRQSHYRLGYSQVMNPYYLSRKGSFPIWLAIEQLGRPVAKNLLHAVVGGTNQEWRRTRLQGNLHAARDVLAGRVTPERIVDFD